MAAALVTGAVSEAATGGRVSAAPDTVTDFVYVSGAGSSHIEGFAVTESGRLRPIPGAEVATSFGAATLRPSVVKRTLYALGAVPNPAVFVYRIGDDGGLTRIATVKLPAARTGGAPAPIGVSVSPTGSSMAVVYGPHPQGGGLIQGFSLDDRGIPTARGAARPVSSLPIPTAAPLPQSVFSPDGENVYVSQYMSGGIGRFDVRRDGSLSPAREVESGPLAAVNPTFTPNGKFLYTAAEGRPGIGAYRVSGSGRLTQLAGSPFAPQGLVPHGISIAPNGKFLYAPDALGNSTWGYRIGADGRLAPLPGAPYPGRPSPVMSGQNWVTGDGSRLVTVDILGTQDAPHSTLRSYRIRKDGSLVRVPGGVSSSLIGSIGSTIVPAQN
ncbi:MAG: beta-propeller fold lactonase family protein [Gordonia sp. (in: high G+C Gram-positive bacteria)]|uniref:lactonase family protein n=1 Tax=Gordonia sp. (in: high G+C Gram-positive bacteria) TaxID=84139 RepID=UPI0039E665F5